MASETTGREHATARPLAQHSTDELLYLLLLDTRRAQWEADPLRFGREALASHFSRPSAPMHRRIMEAMMGVGELGERT